MKKPGLPTRGAALELVGGAPRWHWTGAQWKQIKKRITAAPWTHAGAGLPSSASRPSAPADPLAALEALR